MNIEQLHAQILGIETDAANFVARVHEGTVSLEEIEEFGRHAWARIALVQSQLNTLDRLEFIRSVEATIAAL